MMTDIKIGSIVKLNSGGPRMTVVSLNDGFVGCSWFSCKPLIINGVLSAKEYELSSNIFPINSLING